MKRIFTKLFKVGFLLALFSLEIGNLNAQTENSISGSIIDAHSGEPVIGAVVGIKGTNAGVSTNEKGAFSLQLPKVPAILLISGLGYKAQRIDVYSFDPISISLEESNLRFDEVVVTGYSTQQKKSITGSIFSLDLDESLKSTPASSFNQLLQGKATGVQVSSNSGVPGGGITFRVRGSNSVNASASLSATAFVIIEL